MVQILYLILHFHEMTFLELIKSIVIYQEYKAQTIQFETTITKQNRQFTTPSLNIWSLECRCLWLDFQWMATMARFQFLISA
jgi:hypothetical protein